jgi:hypothetical protein
MYILKVSYLAWEQYKLQDPTDLKIMNRHAGQRRSTFLIYLVFASKAAHLDCGMCPKVARPFCQLALCNWTMKAGAIGLDGSVHPTSNCAALPCLIVRISRWPHEPTRTRGAHRQPRPHIDRALVLR